MRRLLTNDPKGGCVRFRIGAKLIAKPLLSAITTLSLASVCTAGELSESSSLYVGAFGGLGSLDEVSMQQVGTVVTPNPIPDIDVDARGSADSVAASVVGVQLGFEDRKSYVFSSHGWRIGIGAEVEGLLLKAEPEGGLDIDPYLLGTQNVSLPLEVGVVLVNAVFNIRAPHLVAMTPYAGFGLGYGAVFIDGSDSTNPSEPGINHFNSAPDASSGGLAFQGKIGVRAAIFNSWSVFTELRHIQIASTEFKFGDTDYPGEHLPTTKWNVDLGKQQYNLWVAGVSYHF
ncbi:MAG: outer membrane protein [Pseudomonadales bacterium]